MPAAAPTAPAPQPSAAATAAHGYGEMVAAPLEGAAHVASGLVSGPASGLAGLGTMATNAVGLTHADPADVVAKVGNALTYGGHTDAGKQTIGAIDTVAGLPAKAGDVVGQKVSDVTGSPALGAAANTALQGAGMWATGKVPAVASAIGRTAPVRAAVNLASDYLPGGVDRATNRVISDAANNTPNGGATAAKDAIQQHLDAQAALARAGRSGALAPDGTPIPSTGPQDLATKYGISPTGTQVAGSPGLAQLDRTIRNQGPEAAGPLNDADTQNRAAIDNILKGISGTPEERLRAMTARDFNARTAYDDALNNPEHFVPPPTADDRIFANEANAKNGITQDGTQSTNDPNAAPTGLNDIGARLQDLLQRPAMQDAMNNANRIAANFGKTIDQRNLIQQMHYAKMHLDDQIGAAQAAGKSNDFRALLDTKNTLLGVMDDLSPAYKDARQSFQTASAPLNRMDVGNALRQKYLSALQEASGTGSRPSMFLDALRRDDGDTLAQQATGFSGASLDKILTPEDMAALDAARGQLGREAFAQNSGRGVGSNTGQNLAGADVLNSVGNMRAATGPMGTIAGAITHPAISAGLDLLGTGRRAATKANIGKVLADPDLLRQALTPKTTGPGAVSSGLHPVAMPASVGATSASDTDANNMADGGQPEYQKSSFWDLAKQAWKELSGSEDTPAPAPPTSQQSAGTTASGSVGADFDRRVDAAVADQS
jgi:hypothetical protein